MEYLELLINRNIYRAHMKYVNRLNSFKNRNWLGARMLVLKAASDSLFRILSERLFHSFAPL